MVLVYRDQIKFLDRLKLVVNAMKGLPPDYEFRPGSGRRAYRRRAGVEGA